MIPKYSLNQAYSRINNLKRLEDPMLSIETVSSTEM